MTAARTVRLHLLRHAHAGDPSLWTGRDADRPLSDRGIGQARAMGALLAEAGFRPDVVVTSPKARAAETARLVAEELGVAVVVDDALAGGFGIGDVDALLTRHGDPKRPLLVGHDPDFSLLAADLAGVTDLPMAKGALVRLDAERPLRPGRGLLRWLVPPDLLAVDRHAD